MAYIKHDDFDDFDMDDLKDLCSEMLLDGIITELLNNEDADLSDDFVEKFFSTGYDHDTALGLIGDDFNEVLDKNCLCTVDPTAAEIPGEFPEESRTKFINNGYDIDIWFKKSEDEFDLDFFPAIKEIDVDEGKSVVVTWCDDSVAKAEIRGDDQYSLEQGLSICVGKKMAEELYGDGYGSLYNKLVNYALKAYKRQEKDRAKKAEEEAELKAIRERKLERKKSKKEAALKAQREETVSLMAEALKRAFGENGLKND